MEIKTWHKVVFWTSIAGFTAYLGREYIFRGASYIRRKFSKNVSSVASRWIGVNEIGNNKAFGNDVFQAMMKNVGWNSYEQWCMYFAKAVHYEAFKGNPTEQAKIQKILNGRSQESFSKASKDQTKTYTTITQGAPKVGDIIIFQHKNKPSTGHAGVVVKVNNDNTVETIEGNTSGKSISDGDTVARKKRTSVYGKSIGDDLVLRGFIRKL